VGSVSYAILQRLPAERAAQAVHVRLPNGVTGYIAAAFVRSPVDRRAVFQKTGGRWLVTAFVAGD
jgi:hypothetical protein